jgi:hypothetical protein
MRRSPGTAKKALADPAGQISHWSQFDSGGYFRAMESPDLLVADVRFFFAGLGVAALPAPGRTGPPH